MSAAFVVHDDVDFRVLQILDEQLRSYFFRTNETTLNTPTSSSGQVTTQIIGKFLCGSMA